jgi:hypothetical protein
VDKITFQHVSPFINQRLTFQPNTYKVYNPRRYLKREGRKEGAEIESRREKESRREEEKKRRSKERTRELGGREREREGRGREGERGREGGTVINVLQIEECGKIGRNRRIHTPDTPLPRSLL